jgi:WD40 repeat protein
MNSDRKPFFITGGTLAPDASSYVHRLADTELLASLRHGELCYVLDTRQMGKSSLMVRVAALLKAEGIRTVMLDLTALGQNVTVEQWYLGMLSHLGEQTDLQVELLECWREHREQGGLQRFLRGLQTVLEKLPNDKFVLFFDEVDAVRSLPFSTDELFAAIRECYNRRTHDPLFARLTFCLLGVATPTDLIRDTRSTPFNIGVRIVLTDFTPEEAGPLEKGLPGRSPGRVHRLLKRILHWTGGHPYMTQHLCRAVARMASDDPQSEVQAHNVDEICRRLYLDHAAQETNDHLAFVRTRLLEGTEDPASLLDLYRQVWAGKRVLNDETNPLCAVLRLSGIVRVVRGHFEVRNRIYDRVFNSGWIQANMPGNELRRQRAAYRAGAIRAAGFAAAIIAVIGSLALMNLRSADRAHRAELQAGAEADYTVHLLYDANLTWAQERYEQDGITPTLDLLKETQPVVGKPDLRGFEWYYLHRLCRQNQATLTGHTEGVIALALSPDGETLASGSADSTVRLWNRTTGKQRLCLRLKTGEARSIAFAPQRPLIACGGESGIVVIADAEKGSTRIVLRGHRGPVTSVAFAHNGRLLASGSNDGSVRIWDTTTWKPRAVLPAHAKRGVWTVAFSPDDTLLATGGDDGVARLWKVGTWKPIRTLSGHEWYVYTLAFSPDGKTLATAGGDKTAILWEVGTGRRLHTLHAHSSYVYCVAFSHDGKRLATGGWDAAARLWNVETGALERTIEQTDNVWALAFSDDDHTLISSGADRRIYSFDLRQPAEGRVLEGLPGAIMKVAFEGSRVAALNEAGQFCLWNAAASQPLENLPAPLPPVAVTLRPDGRLDIPALQAAPEWKTLLATAPFALTRCGTIVRPLFFSEDRRLVGIHQGGAISLVNVRTNQEVWHQPEGEYYIHCALAPDGATLVGTMIVSKGTAGADRHDTMVGFDIASGRKLFSLSGQSEDANSVSYAPDSRYFIVTAGISAQVRDARSGRLLRTLSGHTRQVGAAEVSHDGRRIVTVSLDGTAKIWDVATGRVLITLRDQHPLHAVAFSANDRRILTGSADGSVRLWDSLPMPQATLAKW